MADYHNGQNRYCLRYCVRTKPTQQTYCKTPEVAVLLKAFCEETEKGVLRKTEHHGRQLGGQGWQSTDYTWEEGQNHSTGSQQEPGFPGPQ